MTLARGLAVGGARASPSSWRSCCWPAATSTSTRWSSRARASSSRTTTCRSAAAASARVARSSCRQQPGRGQDRRSTSPTRRCTRARPRRSAPARCRASPTATSRWRPAPTAAGQARRRRHARPRQDDDLGRPRPALRHARPRRRARACRRSSRAPRTQYEGKGAQANEALKYFNPTLSTTARLVNELDRDQQSLQDFIVYTARADDRAGRQARRHLQPGLQRRTPPSGAIASESDSLNEALSALPRTLRQANTTFVNLRSTLDDLDDARRRLQAGRAEARAVLPAAAPAGHRGAPDDPRPQLADLAQGRRQRPDRPAQASSRS